jgi:hypothetical protein
VAHCRPQVDVAADEVNEPGLLLGTCSPLVLPPDCEISLLHGDLIRSSNGKDLMLMSSVVILMVMPGRAVSQSGTLESRHVNSEDLSMRQPERPYRPVSASNTCLFRMFSVSFGLADIDVPHLQKRHPAVARLPQI